MIGAFLIAAGISACSPGRAAAAPAPNRSLAGALAPAPARSLSDGECQDSPPAWTDSEGYNCAQHESYQWCTSSGGYGVGYDTSWGTWQFWATQGVGADQACCACGGGTVGSAATPTAPNPSPPAWAPTPGQMCVDEPGWTDVTGFSCHAYSKVGAELCTPSGGVGAGWQGTGLSPSLDALAPANGVSAADACCFCGGGMLCADTEGSAVDARGDNCADGYSDEPYEVCHMYDDEDFSAGHMCCECLGISPAEQMVEGEGCVDSPDGWNDLYGFTCETYSEDLGAGWCSTSGGFGSKWDVSWGSWETLVNMGHHAAEACCSCGGGLRVSGTATTTTDADLTSTGTTTSATTLTVPSTVTTTTPGDPTPAPPTPVPITETTITHTTTLTTLTQVNWVVQQRLTFQSTGSIEEIGEVVRLAVRTITLAEASDVLLVFVKPATSQPFRRLTQSTARSRWHADYQLFLQTESIAKNKATYIGTVGHIWKFELRTGFQVKALSFDETSLVVGEPTYKAYALTAALTGDNGPDPTPAPTATEVTTARPLRPVVVGAAGLPTTTTPASASALQPAASDPAAGAGAQASSTGVIIAFVSGAFAIGGCAAGAIFLQHRRKRLNANNNNNNNNLNRRRSPVDDVQANVVL